MGRNRIEISTYGVDDTLQGVSGDPFTPSAQGSYTGLRIPTVLSASATPATQPRYLFCLCSTTFQHGISLLGIRQGLTIGIDANLGTAPIRPVEQMVHTPTFKFVDGNVSWHLVIEKQPDRVPTSPNTDTQNWQFRQGDGPSMLYEKFVNSTIDPLTGAPILYFVGLTSYTAPDLSGGIISGVAGLGTFHDIRFPWDQANDWRDFGEGGLRIEGGGRLSFYASVLQTNPNNRGNATKQMTSLSSSNLPEESFTQDYTVAGTPNLGPIYWRVMGAMIVEKDESTK